MLWLHRLQRHHSWMTIPRLAVLASLALLATFAGAGPAFADDRPDGAELATAGAMMVVIVIMFIAGVVGIWWSHGNGEFDEPEEVKYQMLAMVEDEVDYWDMGMHEQDDELFDDAPERPLISGTVS